MSHRHEKSYKLFYGKYLYRLEIRNSLAAFFREKNLPLARSTLDSLHSQYDLEAKQLFVHRGLRHQIITETEFFDAVKLYSAFVKMDDYKLRVQTNYINIYANDLSWLKNIIKQVSPDRVSSLWQPDESYKKLLTSNTIVIENDIGYEYRVTFGTKEGEPEFLKWAESNPKLIKLGPVLKEELRCRGYVNGMYFYARDEKVLNLCTLITSNIRRIDKLIVKPDIDK